jgi:hypothetical protein
MLNIITLASLLTISSAALPNVISFASPSLFPESIDIDTTTNTLIAGSISQGVLVTVSMQGEVASFINDTEVSGAGRGIIGVQVDSINRVVWTCVQDLGFAGNFAAFAGIAAYDLDTKERKFLSGLNNIDPSGDPRGVTCNDVVQTADGSSAYITDSFGDRLFKVTSDGIVTLESADQIFAKNDPAELFGINGIEINSQNELIITQQLNKVLFTYSLDTKSVTIITGLPLIAGDGIIFTDEARTTLAVTDVDGLVYSVKLNGSTGTIIGTSQRIAPAGIITCTVAIDGEVFALSAYLNELFSGIATREVFALTKVVYAEADGTTTTAGDTEPTESSAMPIIVVSVVTFIVTIAFLA